MLQGTIIYMGGWSTLKKDAAYCYPCCMFGSTSISTSRPENVLLPLGFMIGSMLPGLKGMLLSHNNCISHNGKQRNCKPNEYSRLKV